MLAARLRIAGWMTLACLALASVAATQPDGSAAAPSPAPPTPPATDLTRLLPGGARVAVIRVEGLIYDFTLESLQHRVDKAVKAGASIVVVELNTPGGLLDSALKIARYLKSLQVTTVAWVNDEAYSAGILIAAACDHLVMSPAAATGDCAPISVERNLAPTERAKALSPLLEEFRDSARQNGYDFALFHAMCELGVDVYQVRHKTTGQLRLVNQADFQVMVQGRSLAEAAPGWSGPSATQPLALAAGPARPHEATDADRGQWELLRKVHDGATQLLTLSTTRAVEVGLARAVVRDDAELQRALGAASVTRIPQQFTEVVAWWLTRPLVRALLVMVFFLGAYIEAQAPGIGLAGILSGAALVCLIGAPFLIGLGEIWHVILFVIGLALLLVEVFLPSFGVLGIVGIICMFVGLVLAVVPSGGGGLGLPGRESLGVLQTSVIGVILGLLLAAVGFYFVSQHFGALPGLSRLVLGSARPAAEAESDADAPPPAGAAATGVSGDESVGQGQVRVGDRGQVVAELRPVGQARINGRTVEVMSRGEWLPVGRAVRIVEVQGNSIVVEATA